MKILKILIILVLTLTITACPFKKKKETPPWVTYQKNTEATLQSLRNLQDQDFTKTDLALYKESLQKTEAVVNQFLTSNQTNPPRSSYLEIEAALQDFHLALELLERKRTKSGDSFFADKIFATSDAALFSKVKQCYKLGAELQTASHSYYYIDPIVHEAMRSADNHIARATKKLKDEVTLEAKTAKNTSKPAEPNSSTTPEPNSSPTSSNSNSKTLTEDNKKTSPK